MIGEEKTFKEDTRMKTRSAVRKTSMLLLITVLMMTLLPASVPALGEEAAPEAESAAAFQAEAIPVPDPEALDEAEVKAIFDAMDPNVTGQFLEDSLPVDFPAGTDIQPTIPEHMEAVQYIDTFDDEEQPLAVIGSDDRKTIKNLNQFPYCAIAYIEVTGTCGHSWCGTGFMISDRWLMTAGHCLYCTKHSAWPEKIQLYFGYRNRSSYYYRYNGGCNAWVSSQVANARDGDNSTYSEYDYGFIRLDQSTGNKTGNFGVIWGERDSTLRSRVYYCAGYADGMLKMDYDGVQPINERRISHTIDMVAGNSGSPIYNSEYFAVAINTAEAMSKTKNFGVRLSGEIYQNILKAGFPN